jgi:hypothetical protein
MSSAALALSGWRWSATVTNRPAAFLLLAASYAFEVWGLPFIDGFDWSRGYG